MVTACALSETLSPHLLRPSVFFLSLLTNDVRSQQQTASESSFCPVLPSSRQLLSRQLLDRVNDIHLISFALPLPFLATCFPILVFLLDRFSSFFSLSNHLFHFSSLFALDR